MSKCKLGVLFGGRSTEYAISLMSVQSVLSNLDSNQYEIIPIGITKQGEWRLFAGSLADIKNDTWEYHAPSKVALLPNSKKELAVFKDYTYEIINLDVMFPVLHGMNGEDGTMQGLFELAGIPYVGCGVAASANCMDKVVASALFDYYQIPHCHWDWTYDEQFLQDVGGVLTRLEKISPYPLFVKPSRSGSSVGVRKVHNREELEAAVRYAAQFDHKIIVEEGIFGREIETAVLGNLQAEVSVCGEILSSNEIYDYNAKYIDGKSNAVIPADMPEALSAELRELALKAYHALDCKGLARVDFFVRKSDQKPLINEINTLPGFTSISMYPKLMLATGLTYPQLLDRLIRLA